MRRVVFGVPNRQMFRSGADERRRRGDEEICSGERGIWIGAMPTSHVSNNESGEGSSESSQTEDGSDDSGSTSRSESSGRSRSFSSSSNSTDDSSISGTRTQLVEGYESGISSAPSSTRRSTSRNNFSTSESSSSTSSSDIDGGGNDIRKSRMKNLFKKQTREAVEPEDLGELHDRWAWFPVILLSI